VGFEFWKFFKRLFRMYEGVIKLAGEAEWIYFDHAPPLGMNYWHCQYLDGEQRLLAEEFGCRGAPSASKKNWHGNPQLTRQQVLALGSSSICQLPEDGSLDHHSRRTGQMLTCPRLMVLLVVNGGQSISTAVRWWRSLENITGTKQRSNMHRKGNGKGKGSRHWW
jgi:hypothetical protein